MQCKKKSDEKSEGGKLKLDIFVFVSPFCRCCNGVSIFCCLADNGQDKTMQTGVPCACSSIMCH